MAVKLGVGPGLGERAALQRRIRRLVAATISYNLVEGVVAIGAGIGASSAALVGFGLDSSIEVASALAVAWQFAGRDPEAREHIALRIIAVSFFALALYVSVEALRTLAGAAEAEHSTVGLALAAVSLAVMPVLSYAQRQAGRRLGSATAVADSKQTLLCTYLSAVLLVGLGLNSLFGWSWADPVAALVIAAIAVREGRDAWRGETCCDTAPARHATATGEDGACHDTCCYGPTTTTQVQLGTGEPSDNRSRHEAPTGPPPRPPLTRPAEDGAEGAARGPGA
jgi:Cation efflux family